MTGEIALSEMKASSTAPLTPNQRVVYPELETYGGAVVGKGKAPYVGGTKIPPTRVTIIRKPRT
jgi:filamentous hemagglutinin